MNTLLTFSAISTPPGTLNTPGWLAPVAIITLALIALLIVFGKFAR